MPTLVKVCDHLDPDEALRHLRQEKVSILYDTGNTGPVMYWGESHSIYIKDPDSHDIKLTSKFSGGLA
ncbi:MAG: hypothetical protein ISR45_04820 [Rhodospirillales bacterium]|nr:hypothetical protein [Rhodospirillales bacterium]